MSHTLPLLTCEQAKRVTGISATRIAKACNNGDLPCEVVTAGLTGKRSYQINPSDLDAWVEGPSAPKRYASRSWSDADISAIVEMYRAKECTVPQIAAFFGCSKNVIRTKLKTVGVFDRSHSYKFRNRVAFRVPPRAILVCRTCSRCHEVRDAAQFPKGTGGGGKSNWCYRCHSDRRRLVFKKEPNYIARNKIQELTAARACNKSKKYTQADIEVLKDVTKPDAVVALELGRTLSGIHNKRHATGTTTTPARGARKAPTPALWRIDIAVEERAVVEYFRRVGEPVPEELWEWHEESVA